MHLPGPLRAAVGLAATAADELKNIPDRAIELPMLAVSTALQMSLRAQQRYARLAARGEQVLNREQPGEEPPPWATFDEPVSVEELRRAALSQLDSLVDDEGTSGHGGADAAAEDERGQGFGSAGDALSRLLDDEGESLGSGESGGGRSAGRMFEDLFGVTDPEGSTGEPAGGEDTGATVTPISHAPGATTKSGAAPRKSARKTSRKTATRKAASKKAPSTTEDTAETAGESATESAAPAADPTTDQPGKQVNKPRHTAPSKFDDADDS